jgi:2-methylcitrate dehydratase PrpD
MKERSSHRLTRKLAAFVARTRHDDFPDDVADRARACLLDWIGSAFSGTGSATARIGAELIRGNRGRRAATLVGASLSAPPAEAALYNGMVSAVTEIDDVHEEASLHTGIGVIPAALAAAESTGASGKDLLSAVILGYDVAGRIARAAGPSHYAFWHTTGTCDTFGAAAAAGKVLGLDEEALAMALGLAGTQAAGLWESLNEDAVMAKHLHSGKAAFNGVLSAQLAGAGFRGSGTIIEGEKGFLASSSKATEEDRRRLAAAFGRPFLITRNFFKRFACCRAAFEGMEAIEACLKEDGFSAGGIRNITVTMKPNRLWLVHVRTPRSVYEAKFSQPFCMALVAARGTAWLHDFTEENLRDPEIRSFMARVRLVADPGCSVKARIEFSLRGGRTIVKEPVCRSLDARGVREKFIMNMAPILGRRKVDRLIDCVNRLDDLEAIEPLSKLLRKT